MSSTKILKAYNVMKNYDVDISEVTLDKLQVLKSVIEYENKSHCPLLSCPLLSCTKCPLAGLVLKEKITTPGDTWMCKRDDVREHVYEAMKTLLRVEDEYEE